jgi:DNA-binding protein YbaB
MGEHMNEFGDFGDIDVERLLREADKEFARIDGMQDILVALVGRAADEDGLVTAEYTGEGLRELEIHPKAMRLASGDLADKIKEVVAAATADLQRQIRETMGEIFGERDNPLQVVEDPGAMIGKIQQAEAVYDRTFDDVMGELDRIRRRLEL